MTREERNVLIFLTVGLLLGSWPMARPDRSSPTPVVKRAGGEREGARSSGGSDDVVVADLFPIDLNDASAELLTELPGIGPARARAIVELRTRRGPFGSVDELAEVRGIGPKTVESLRDRVSVAGATEGEPGENPLGERPAGDAAARERRSHAGADGTGQEPGEVQR